MRRSSIPATAKGPRSVRTIRWVLIEKGNTVLAEDGPEGARLPEPAFVIAHHGESPVPGLDPNGPPPGYPGDKTIEFEMKSPVSTNKSGLSPILCRRSAVCPPGS